MTRAESGATVVATWAALEPGVSADQLVDLEEGAYEFSGTFAAVICLSGSAQLTVQRQEALPGEPAPGRTGFRERDFVIQVRTKIGCLLDPDSGQRVFPEEPGAANEENFKIAEAAYEEEEP